MNDIFNIYTLYSNIDVDVDIIIIPSTLALNAVNNNNRI